MKQKYSQIPRFLSFKGYHAILFDLDGVFINSNDAWIIALQNILDEENLKFIPSSVIEKHLALSTRRQIEYFFPELKNIPERVNDLVIKVDRYYRDHIADYVNLNEGSHELLSCLKKQFKLALVTNNGEKVTLSILNHFDFQKYFDTVIHLDIMQQPKPNPAAIYSALSKLSVDKQSAVFIGDSPSDLETSLRANIQFILIRDASSTFIYPQIPQNVKIVSKVKDLLTYC